LKTLWLAVVALLLASLAFAQNHTDIVAAVKAELQAQGKDLSGACGAFSITKRVAWRLRSEGAGLLSKPGGNNCEGYSVDYVTYPDGSGIDILGDAGGANSPGWDQGEVAGALSGRWRAPFDPGDVAIPPVVVLPPPVTAPPSTATLEAQILAALLALQVDERETKALAAENLAQIKAHRAGVQAVWLKVSVIGGPIVAAVVTWINMRSAPAAAK
jgi:hypothetical protein